jgi:branched-chain amino acid aminotransferase
VFVYVNGRFVPREEAKVSVFDNGYLFGDGVFEGIRAYGGRIFRLEEHIDRLFDSAKAIWLRIPGSHQEMMDICADTCAANGLDSAYIRLVVSRGEGDLGLDPRNAGQPNLVCIASQITLYPEEFIEKGLRVITAATRRNYGEVLPPQVKSCNYLPNIMARIEAVNAGAHEAVCMSREGYVAECTGDNIFVVKDGIVKTPHHGAGLLRGITRKAVLELCASLALPTQETFMNRWRSCRSRRSTSAPSATGIRAPSPGLSGRSSASWSGRRATRSRGGSRSNPGCPQNGFPGPWTRTSRPAAPRSGPPRPGRRSSG